FFVEGCQPPEIRCHHGLGDRPLGSLAQQFTSQSAARTCGRSRNRYRRLRVMIASKRSPTAIIKNARPQRRPEKLRVASVHLRPRPMALPHLRLPLPVLEVGTQTHPQLAQRDHAAEHVRVLPSRSLAAKETPLILPYR